MKTVLITGAAGNLGSLLACHMAGLQDIQLRLMIHRKNLPDSLKEIPASNIFRADLSDPSSLDDSLRGTDAVIHFAGVLFKHKPEKFLPLTNTVYFKNLLDKAIEHGVKRVILISFPHVEGETTPDAPAVGKINAKPSSVHATTRLEEEKYLFSMQQKHDFEAVSLRVGMVYGRGILMIDGARWFAKYKLLGVWRKPTWIHLVSTRDFLESCKSALLNEKVKGIYHIGDEGIQTLQDFLDLACMQWGYKKPWRMSVGLIMTAARIFEFWSFVFGTRSPLTRDFIRIGMASYYGDTTSMRKELLPELRYKTVEDGKATL
ncbi:MAG: NAD(P)-dependent oxidoreductase [Bacteroidota bacterium]